MWSELTTLCNRSDMANNDGVDRKGYFREARRYPLGLLFATSQRSGRWW